MTTLTITAKGQVTLRKEILRHLGVGPGDRVVVDTLSDGRIEVKARQSRGKISDAFDYLKRDNGPVLSIEDMNAIATKGWTGKT